MSLVWRKAGSKTTGARKGPATIQPSNPLLCEDEIRSVEGPDALRGGPEGTAPNGPRTPVPSHTLVLRCGFELDEDQFHTPVADVLGKVRHGAAPVGVASV